MFHAARKAVVDPVGAGGTLLPPLLTLGQEALVDRNDDQLREGLKTQLE